MTETLERAQLRQLVETLADDDIAGVLAEARHRLEPQFQRADRPSECSPGPTCGHTKRPRRGGFLAGTEPIADRVDDYLVGFGQHDR